MYTYQINNLIHMHIKRKKSIHSNNKKNKRHTFNDYLSRYEKKILKTNLDYCNWYFEF